MNTSEYAPTPHDEQQLAVEAWLQTRKEAALGIDPETAEVFWHFALTLDPYGVLTDIPEEWRQIGRAYFARAPGSDIWVWFGDLPGAIAERLWELHRQNLAFPAGLFI